MAGNTWYTPIRWTNEDTYVLGSICFAGDRYYTYAAMVKEFYEDGQDFDGIVESLSGVISSDVNDLYEEAVQTLRERGISSAADLFMRMPEFDTYQIAEEIVNEEYPPYRQKYSGSKRSASSNRPRSKSPAKKKATTKKAKGARR